MIKLMRNCLCPWCVYIYHHSMLEVLLGYTQGVHLICFLREMKSSQLQTHFDILGTIVSIYKSDSRRHIKLSMIF